MQTKEQAFERWSGNIARTVRAVVTTMIKAFGSASLFGAHIAMGAGSQTRVDLWQVLAGNRKSCP